MKKKKTAKAEGRKADQQQVDGLRNAAKKAARTRARHSR